MGALMPGNPDEEDEEEDYSTTPIPLPAVEAQHLELILEWCKHELENKDAKEDLKAGVYHVAGILHKLTPKQIWERYNPDKPLPTKDEIDNIFKDPQLEWAAMPDFSWGE